MPAVIFGFVLLGIWLWKNSAAAAQQCAEDEASGAVKASGSNGFAINNPGNIRWIANPSARWQGMIANHNGYAEFDTLSNGVRAIGKQLGVDYNRGANTVTKIITIWAPAADDNNTQAYIADVSQKIGLPPDQQFASLQDVLPDLTAAIIYHENGYNSIDATDLISYLNS